MVTIQCDDFDIRKIMASGQCFRITEKYTGYRPEDVRYFELVAFGRLLQVQ